MERRELLQERYEDALFALLMDELATAEGERALAENERLKNDPAAQVPETLDRRCERAIRKSFTKRTTQNVGHFTFEAMKKVVMAVGVAAMLFTSAFAVSENVRANTMNLVIEIFDGYADFNFSGEPSRQKNEMWLEVGWIPEGYVLVKQECDTLGLGYRYEKSETEYISVDYSKTVGMEMTVDIEGAEISEMEINGMKATWIKTEKVQHLVLVANDQEGVVDLVAEGISEKDFFRVATNLEYKK